MVSDFGLSKTLENGVMSTACGTPGYVGEMLVDPRKHLNFVSSSFEELVTSWNLVFPRVILSFDRLPYCFVLFYAILIEFVKIAYIFKNNLQV